MKFFRRRPVKYRCFHCDRRVREGERHDYVRCVSGTSWLTLLVDRLDDHAAKAMAIFAIAMCAWAAWMEARWAIVLVLGYVAFVLAAKLDKAERRRG